ncbi:MAG: ATP synthase F1 subunit epsilon [Candidatus Saccharimonadales bacterium]|jgi:F-type H+-transporting ATPase subunit epsilon
MIHLQLVTSKGTKFDSDVYEVLIPTQGGTIALYENHMPLISAGNAGLISVRKEASTGDDDMEHFAIAGGVIQIDGKTARFISDDITTSEEVSEQEAAEAMARAQEMMVAAESRTALHEAKRMLQHSSAQLQLARLKKRHHR